MRRHITWFAPLMISLIYALPIVLQERAVACARGCFSSLESRTVARLPDCEACASGLWLSRRAPWTRDYSRRVHEELTARAAVVAYLDAAVGQPSRAGLRQRFEPLWPAWRLTDGGTGSLKLDLLGPSIPAPQPGSLAKLAGDRRTLVDHGLRWNQWYVATAAIEAALIEGEIDRAVRLAEHYRGRPNTDLRVRVAAMLCIGMPKAKRGIVEQAYQHAIEVMNARATKRNADFARDFGSARVVVEACAARLGVPPPKMPAVGHAGRLDYREQRLALHWRLAKQSGDPTRLAKARRAVEGFLRGPQPTAHRYALAALVIDASHSLVDAADLLTLRPGQLSLHAPSRDRPVISTARYEAARAHLSMLMDAADPKRGQPLMLARLFYDRRLKAARPPPPPRAWLDAPLPAAEPDPRLAAWRAVPAPERRRVRYALFRQTDRKLESPAAYLFAAGHLAAGPSEVELWLDALTSRDLRSHSLSTWAQARAVAAKRRNDQVAATLWWQRYQQLRLLLAEPATAELYLYLRL
jgi:hypothetical protein